MCQVSYRCKNRLRNGATPIPRRCCLSDWLCSLRFIVAKDEQSLNDSGFGADDAEKLHRVARASSLCFMRITSWKLVLLLQRKRPPSTEQPHSVSITPAGSLNRKLEKSSCLSASMA